MIASDQQAFTAFANRALLPLMVLVTWHKTMIPGPDELMRRFPLHVLSGTRRGCHFALLDPNTGAWSLTGLAQLDGTAKYLPCSTSANQNAGLLTVK